MIEAFKASRRASTGDIGKAWATRRLSLSSNRLYSVCLAALIVGSWQEASVVLEKCGGNDCCQWLTPLGSPMDLLLLVDPGYIKRAGRCQDIPCWVLHNAHDGCPSRNKCRILPRGRGESGMSHPIRTLRPTYCWRLARERKQFAFFVDAKSLRPRYDQTEAYPTVRSNLYSGCC